MQKLSLYTTVLFLNLFLILSSYLIIDVAFKQFYFKIDWGFIGALLGGVISGGMTLMGVKRTIKANEKEKALNAIPKKIMVGENILYELTGQKNFLLSNLRDGNLFFMRERMRFILMFFENDGFLKESANVNYRFYKATRKMYEAALDIQKSQKTIQQFAKYIEIMESELKVMDLEIKKLNDVLNNE